MVSLSHEHLGATASDLGSVGECANCRALSVHWCQDGKCATWLFDRINLDPKIQIKYIDTKNQLKGNFTRDEWNHPLCFLNISHFSSTVCSEAMTKRVQQDSGEERFTAKSRPMMSLVARVPSTLSSSASESPGKKSFESQSPWSAKAEKNDRTGTPVVCPQRGARPQQFIIGDDEAEFELSLGPRSFLDRVNDQVRKRQKRSSINVKENHEKHSVIWGMFMSVTFGIICIHGKELLTQLTFHHQYERPHNETNVRHIFEIGV